MQQLPRTGTRHARTGSLGSPMFLPLQGGEQLPPPPLQGQTQRQRRGNLWTEDVLWWHQEVAARAEDM